MKKNTMGRRAVMAASACAAAAVIAVAILHGWSRSTPVAAETSTAATELPRGSSPGAADSDSGAMAALQIKKAEIEVAPATIAPPGPPTRKHPEPASLTFPDELPLVDRMAALEDAANAGDMQAAAKLAEELFRCRGHLVTAKRRELDVTRVLDDSRSSEAERTFREDEYLQYQSSPETHAWNARCKGLDIPSVKQIVDAQLRAAELGDVKSMIDYYDSTNDDAFLAGIVRQNPAELASIRSNQLRHLQEAARRCYTPAFVAFAFAPHLTRSATERYALSVVAGWLLTGLPARGTHTVIIPLQLSPSEEQTSLRMANAIYRHYCS